MIKVIRSDNGTIFCRETEVGLFDVDTGKTITLAPEDKLVTVQEYRNELHQEMIALERRLYVIAEQDSIALNLLIHDGE